MKTSNELGLHLTRAYIDRKPLDVLLNLESGEKFNSKQAKPILVPAQLFDAAMQKTKNYG